MEIEPGFTDEIGRIQVWNGSPLPRRLHMRLEREYERKLIIELWKYLETGVVPEGACLKSN